MASIKVNGVSHQSGSGAHPSKTDAPRQRTRSASKEKAIKQEMGVQVARGTNLSKLDSSDR